MEINEYSRDDNEVVFQIAPGRSKFIYKRVIQEIPHPWIIVKAIRYPWDPTCWQPYTFCRPRPLSKRSQTLYYPAFLYTIMIGGNTCRVFGKTPENCLQNFLMSSGSYGICSQPGIPKEMNPYLVQAPGYPWANDIDFEKFSRVTPEEMLKWSWVKVR